jgi:hypothetical protein
MGRLDATENQPIGGRLGKRGIPGLFRGEVLISIKTL